MSDERTNDSSHGQRGGGSIEGERGARFFPSHDGTKPVAHSIISFKTTRYVWKILTRFDLGRVFHVLLRMCTAVLFYLVII